MSVARNLWRAADAPHIVPADSVERQTAQRLINACPALRDPLIISPKRNHV